MKLTASVVGLLTAMGMSVLASAATAEPLSAPALMQVAAKHHHVARHSQTCDETDPKQVYEIVREGTRKGRAVAQATMEEVRAAMKIAYKFE